MLLGFARVYKCIVLCLLSCVEHSIAPTCCAFRLCPFSPPFPPFSLSSLLRFLLSSFPPLSLSSLLPFLLPCPFPPLSLSSLVPFLPPPFPPPLSLSSLVPFPPCPFPPLSLSSLVPFLTVSHTCASRTLRFAPCDSWRFKATAQCVCLFVAPATLLRN